MEILPADFAVIVDRQTETTNHPAIKLTFSKAIRLKCLDCSCGSPSEVKFCAVKQCPLFPFRFGKRPQFEGHVRKKKRMTAERIEKLKAQLHHNRQKIKSEHVDRSI